MKNQWLWQGIRVKGMKEVFTKHTRDKQYVSTHGTMAAQHGFRKKRLEESE
ncbi:hypothetical protein [Blautia marasmi]|uniref:hypothetical protein n=1 Tax=Blautia marasmi TaxID=1917868 RepID=UPI00210A176F|nr:hypothetical protein [Blautia marasmi]